MCTCMTYRTGLNTISVPTEWLYAHVGSHWYGNRTLQWTRTKTRCLDLTDPSIKCQQWHAIAERCTQLTGTAAIPCALCPVPVMMQPCYSEILLLCYINIESILIRVYHICRVPGKSKYVCIRWPVGVGTTASTGPQNTTTTSRARRWMVVGLSLWHAEVRGCTPDYSHTGPALQHGQRVRSDHF